MDMLQCCGEAEDQLASSTSDRWHIYVFGLLDLRDLDVNSLTNSGQACAILNVLDIDFIALRTAISQLTVPR